MKALKNVLREDIIYQFVVLECIEHLKVAFALTAIKVCHMLPKPIHTSQSQKPVRVNLPCVPMEQRQIKEQKKFKHNHNS